MNKGWLVVVACIGGFLIGILLNELLAIMGQFVFQRWPAWPRGLKYVPLITGFIAAAAVWIWAPRRRKA